MGILKWELLKILQRRSTQICILLAFGYVIFATTFTGIHNLGSGTSNGWNNNDGIQEIKKQYAYADVWKGKMTGEKLSDILDQYKMAHKSENMKVYEDGSVGLTNEAYEKYISPLGPIPTFLWITFSWYPEYSSVYHIENIPNNLVADYYEQRDNIVAEYLQSQVINEDDRNYFRKQETQVEKPFYYDWYEGQSMFLEILEPIPEILAVLFCIITAPIFAYEYQQKTDSILLSTKRGRRKLAIAKIASALIVTVPLYILCILTYLIGQFAFVGTRALNCPIQLIKPLATAPLTIGEAEIYTIILGLFSCIAMVLLTALFSSCMKSVAPVIVLSLAVLFVPLVFKNVIPQALDIVTTMIPFMNGHTELFRTNRYHLFGKGIWSPYLMLISMVIIPYICVPITLLKYRIHEVVE